MEFVETQKSYNTTATPSRQASSKTLSGYFQNEKRYIDPTWPLKSVKLDQFIQEHTPLSLLLTAAILESIAHRLKACVDTDSLTKFYPRHRQIKNS